MSEPTPAERAPAEIAASRKRLDELEKQFGLPPAGGPARPRTRDDVRAMSAEAVAEQLATPDGRAAVQRALTGGRDLAGLDLADPAVLRTLSMEEVAANYAAIEAAQKAAKEAAR